MWVSVCFWVVLLEPLADLRGGRPWGWRPLLWEILDPPLRAVMVLEGSVAGILKVVIG